MEYYLMIARSVTLAQRMQSALVRAGISCQIFRAPRNLSESGCAYVVRILQEDLTETLNVLRREKLDPVKIFKTQSK